MKVLPEIGHRGIQTQSGLPVGRGQGGGGRQALTSFYPGRAPVEAYGGGGFRFAGMSHRGSILLLPSGIFAWPVTGMADLEASRLEQVFRERAEIDLMILGTGAAMARPSVAILDAFTAAGFQLDYMATPFAISTYNLLLEEKRKVAAGLLAIPA